MALYESYLDEDISDESVSEAYALDEDLDGLGEDFDESAEDYDEARRRRRTRGRGSWRNRRMAKARQAQPVAVTPTNLRRAFNNVGDDVSILKRHAKMSENARVTSLGVDIVGAALLTPKIVDDAEGKPTIKNNLVPLIGVKLIGNMIGSGSQLDFRKLMPWILAAFLLSPDALKQLGVENAGSNPSSGSNKLLGNMDTTTLLLLGGIFLFASSPRR